MSTTELRTLRAIRDMMNSEAGAGGNSKEHETYTHEGECDFEKAKGYAGKQGV